jgi:CubicO group peptidase (beta-lactamase class C family)
LTHRGSARPAHPRHRFRWRHLVRGGVLLLVGAGRGESQCRPQPATLERTVVTALTDELAKRTATGIAAVIVTPDSVLVECVAGSRGLDPRARITRHTLFHAASLSKTFTAVAALRLVERGRLALPSMLDTYLPQFAHTGGSGLTIRDLLQHSSGLVDVINYEWDAPDTVAGALQRNLSAIIAALPQRTSDGKSRYTNTGYDLLGAIIEQVTDAPFAKYLEDSVLTPAGLQESFFRVNLRDTNRLAAGHTGTQDNLAPTDRVLMNGRHAPSSTLNLSIGDLGRWLQLHLRARTEQPHFLSAESYAAMWDTTTHFTGTSGLPVDRSAGLGWITGVRLGEFAVWHPGSDQGYSAYLMLLPDRGIAAAVLCNGERCDTGGVTQQLLRAVLHAPSVIGH